MAIPKYARRIPVSRRVHFYCKGRCRSLVYGEVCLSREYVTCARCGMVQPDVSNWVSK